MIQAHSRSNGSPDSTATPTDRTFTPIQPRSPDSATSMYRRRDVVVLDVVDALEKGL